MLVELIERELDIEIGINVIKIWGSCDCVRTGWHWSGNSLRWRNGRVLSARKNLENTQMVSTAWWHGVWPPGASVETECWGLECCVLEMGTVPFGLESADRNFDGWGWLTRELCTNHKGEKFLRWRNRGSAYWLKLDSRGGFSNWLIMVYKSPNSGRGLTIT